MLNSLYLSKNVDGCRTIVYMCVYEEGNVSSNQARLKGLSTAPAISLLSSIVLHVRETLSTDSVYRWGCSPSQLRFFYIIWSHKGETWWNIPHHVSHPYITWSCHKLNSNLSPPVTTPVHSLTGKCRIFQRAYVLYSIDILLNVSCINWLTQS